MKILFTAFMIAIAPLLVNAQAGLTKNTSLSSATFRSVFNHKTDTIRLADYAGKFIVLDFWGFKCVSCLRSFPKMDSLQRIYADDIQFLLVNKETICQTDSFLRKRVKVFKPAIPFITGDTMLSGRFNHRSVPYYVILDRTGVPIFQSTYIDELNLKKMIAGQEPNFYFSGPKKYISTILKPEFEDKVVFMSYLLPADGKFDFGNELKYPMEFSLNEQNQTPVMLYQRAYSGLYKNKIDFSWKGRTVLELKDGEGQLPILEGGTPMGFREWLSKYCYNYQLFWKGADSSQIFSKFIADLDHYFPYKATIETRRIKCFALKKIGDLSGLKSKGGVAQYEFVGKGLRSLAADSVKYLKNVPFSSFIVSIKAIVDFSWGTFINEVEVPYNIDISFPGYVLDDLQLITLKKELRRHGMDLVEEMRLQKVLVIKDKTNIVQVSRPAQK